MAGVRRLVPALTSQLMPAVREEILPHLSLKFQRHLELMNGCTDVAHSGDAVSAVIVIGLFQQRSYPTGRGTIPVLKPQTEAVPLSGAPDGGAHLFADQSGRERNRRVEVWLEPEGR